DLELDQQLSRHLAAELEPQAGRALRAFEQHARDQRHRRRLLMAASVAVLFGGAAIAALWPVSRRSSSHPGMVVEKSIVTPDAAAPRNLEQLVAWEASDEGVEQVQLLEQRLPVRKLRQ